jgi:hypothetical protein
MAAHPRWIAAYGISRGKTATHSFSKQLASRYALTGGLARIERLLEAGAQWRPSEPDGGMKSVRQMLCKCEPAVTVALIKLFAKYKAASEELLEELLDTPRMRGHLSTIGMKL